MNLSICVLAFFLSSGTMTHFSIGYPAGDESSGMVRIPAGFYKPFYKIKGLDSIRVPAFYIDSRAVTSRDFLEFVKRNPQWSRSRVSRVLADSGYLSNWKSDFEIGDSAIAISPVTRVSWFASSAYAKWAGKRLPTIYEWEYASLAPLVWPIRASGKRKDSVILNWYSSPSSSSALKRAGSVNSNAFGLFDMFGSVWEWVEDFNSIVIPNDPRGGLDTRFFCGSGAFGTLNPLDYATFMRFAMRSSLKASYTVQDLGFRCAKDIRQ